MMKVLGIDPGKKGGCVLLDSDADVGFHYSFNFTDNNLLNIEPKLIELIDSSDIVLIEKISGRFGWGSTQVFNFGFIDGQIVAVLRMRDKRIVFVSPKVWQGFIHEGISPKLDAKKRSFLAYSQLFPHDPLPKTPRSQKTKPDLIDALEICYYGVNKYARGHLRKWIITEL